MHDLKSSLAEVDVLELSNDPLKKKEKIKNKMFSSLVVLVFLVCQFVCVLSFL